MGACVGTLVINLMAAPIASRLGWQAVFQLTAVGNLIFLTIWLKCAASSPNSSAALSHGERAVLLKAGLYIDKTSKKTDAVQKSAPPIFNMNLFFHTAIWTVIIAHFVQNCQVYLAEWFPLFYNTYLGVSPDVASVCLTIAAAVELPSRTITKNMPDHLR